MSARAPFLGLALILFTLVGSATAAVFESGDLVIPGDRIVDSFGNVRGCMYRLRNGQLTRWFESTKFRSPTDMLIDSAGRIVFAATPTGLNNNETSLFRLDPASGLLERLFRFPYIVAAPDTLPDNAEGVAGFYLFNQSLHLEKSFAIEINDDENGGWPQVGQPECYGFAIGTSYASGQLPTAYRWRGDTNRCEVGTEVNLLAPYTGSIYMAADDDFIYYGLSDAIGRTKPAVRLSVHLDGDLGTFDAIANIPAKNELIIAGGALDNTFIPNGTVNCGNGVVDNNVPFSTVGGCCFAVLSMNGLGVFDGSVYATSNSGATGGPYVFSIAVREPFLNPYNCLWSGAIKGHAPLPFVLPDGTWTSARLTAPDGSSLIGNERGVIHRVTPAGDHSVVISNSGDQSMTGRPQRWNGPSAKQVTSKATVGAQLLMLRADALVHVLVTDALGKRIGFDAAGNPINDFGPTAQTIVGPGGWPKLIVVRDPELGISTVDVHNTGAGDWSVKGYLSHETAGGYSTTTIGSATDVETVIRGLYLGNPLGMSWHQDPTAVDLPAAARVSFVAGPVPSQGNIRFAFRAPEAGAKVELAIFDLRGRRVALPITTTLLAGPQSLDWSGRGTDGQSLARGVYMARLTIDGQQHSRRIVLTN